MADEPRRPPRSRQVAPALLLAAWLLPAAGLAQERTGYILGEQQGLEMMVHIIGEVQKPGEYRVRDQTDLLELLSKAGGPTQFSRLNSVTVRRHATSRPLAAVSSDATPRVEIIQVNVAAMLSNNDVTPPPALLPGDIVFVPRATGIRWKDVSGVIRDVSVVASAYFLYVRARN